VSEVGSVAWPEIAGMRMGDDKEGEGGWGSSWRMRIKVGNVNIVS